jgi:hypothetical protein
MLLSRILATEDLKLAMYQIPLPSSAVRVVSMGTSTRRFYSSVKSMGMTVILNPVTVTSLALRCSVNQSADLLSTVRMS